MPKRAAAEPRRYNEVTSAGKEASDAGKVNLGGRPDKNISKKGLFAIIVHRRLCSGGFPAELGNGYGCFQRVVIHAGEPTGAKNITTVSRAESLCVCKVFGVAILQPVRLVFPVALKMGSVRKVLI